MFPITKRRSKRNFLTVAFTFFLLLQVSAIGAVNGLEITTCTTLSSPGVYELTADIINSSASTCINITSSDVVFDGKSYTIDGVDTFDTYGIYAYNSTAVLTNVTVKKLEVTDWGFGVYFQNTQNGNILNNTVSSNKDHGIWVNSSSGSTLTSNTANSNRMNGIFLYSSSNSTLINNTVNSNDNYGILLSSSSNNTITKNTVNSNLYYGIVLWTSSNNTITKNTASSNTYGIFLDSSSNNNITNNIANSNGYGIFLGSSNGNKIHNNIFNNTNNFYFSGTIPENDWNATKTAGTNIISGPFLGGNFWVKPDGTGFSETCVDSDGNGICDLSYTLASGNVDYLPLSLNIPDITVCYSGCDYTSIQAAINAASVGNTINVAAGTYNENVDVNKSVNLVGAGAEVTFVNASNSNDHVVEITANGANISGFTIYGGDSSYSGHIGIYLKWVNNTHIFNNYLLENKKGIRLWDSNFNDIFNNHASQNNLSIDITTSHNNSVNNNTLFENAEGINLGFSNYNFLTNNSVSKNYNGIYLITSHFNKIIDNILDSNNNGIFLTYSSSNRISNNYLKENNNGILFDESTYNIVANNTASNNGNGIYLYSSSGNKISNNLFNNTANIGFGGTIYGNDWNTTKTPGTNIIGGSYFGGNFWAYPNGTGFSETCIDSDSDGICDLSYTLASGNVDYLPLAAWDGGPILDIKIEVSLNELHDDSTKSDDYTKSTFSNAGYSDASVVELNSSAVLRFDENGDGDLKDSDDYDLYDHLVIRDSASGDIQFAYSWAEHSTYSNGDGNINGGDVIEIKGDRYVVTDNKTSDGNIKLGPAIAKVLIGSTIDKDNAVVVSGTKKLLYSDTGLLLFYDGTSLLETVDLSAITNYPYMLTSDDVTTDEFKIYKIYVVAETKNVLAKITMVEKSQEVSLTNGEENVLGYSSIKIDDSDWFTGGKTGVYFLSEPISLVADSTIDLPGTYYLLEYTAGKEFDILRKTDYIVVDGASLKTNTFPGMQFLTDNIYLNITTGGINISWSGGSEIVADGTGLSPFSYPGDNFLKESIWLKIWNKPDLTLSPYDITFSGSKREGKTITISAVIRNIEKSTNQSFTVAFYDGGQSNGSLIGTSNTTAGGTASVNWTALPGTHNITVFADSANVVNESNESNNIANKSIIIIPQVIPGADIRISLHGKELHDDPSPADDYTKSTFSGSGYNDASVNVLNSTAVLRFDANEDGDLKDSDDYDLYDHVVIRDSASGDIQFAYGWTEHSTYSNGDGNINAGDVIEIKGDRYVVTDNKTSDANIELGPAITKTLSGSSVDKDNAVVVSGTKKVLYSDTGKLYFYDGTSLLEIVDLAGVTDYPYKLTNYDITTDEFKIYKIYVVAETKNFLAKITMVERSQEIKLTNDEEGVFGYSRIKIDDSDWFFGGKTGVYFLSDPISLVKGSTIDLPDTYYSLKYTASKEFDIGRKTQYIVADGAELKNNTYPGMYFLTDNINLNITAGGINVSWATGNDEVPDESDLEPSSYPGDNFLKETIFLEILSKPDLTISPFDISFSDSIPVLGDTITIYAKARNLKKPSTDSFNLTFYANGSLIGQASAYVNQLASINWTPASGDYEIKVVVDEDNSINESDETNNFATRDIRVTFANIKIVFDSNELHDEETYPATDGYKKSTFANAGYNDASVNALNSSAILRFDENADGDLKDSNDYDLYNHLVIIDSTSGDVQFAYNWTEHSTYSNGDGNINAGDVIEIKGDKYVITDNKTSDGNIQLGPAITKTLTGTTIDPNNAVVVAGTKKLLYSDTGLLLFYDGTSLLETVDLSGVSDYPYKMTTDDVTSDEFKIYKIYVVAETKNTSAKITMVEKSQEIKLINDEEGVFGYNQIKIDDSDWFFGGKVGVYFLSDPISLVKGSTIDLPGTYYSLKYTLSKEFDIKRKKVSAVASGTKLKTNTDPGNYFLVNYIIVYVILPPADTTSPTITITSPQNTTYPTTSIYLNVSADELVDTWMYNLNNAGNVTFSPNTTIAGVEGLNNIVVYANDTVGNWGNDTEYFTVNTTLIEITNCTTLSSPGVYTLTADIINSSASTCINITSSDVTFDGRGYMIDGIDAGLPGNSRGIYAYHTAIALTNVTVKNLNVTDWTNGIDYQNAQNGSITNNNASSNYIGIILSSSINNTITNNNASSNNGHGIVLYSSSNNNTITNNTASSNSLGIYILLSSNYNTLSNNTASSNTDYGIYFAASSNNIIYHNNFINNTNQSYDNGNNTWDNGYPSGGNYWSDYDESSEGCNDANSDGFCDSVYNISRGSNYDGYPFTVQDGWLYITPDITPPTITIDSPQNTTYATTSINLNVSADEPIDTWEYSLDGANNITFNLSTASDGFEDGEWTNNPTWTWNTENYSSVQSGVKKNGNSALLVSIPDSYYNNRECPTAPECVISSTGTSVSGDFYHTYSTWIMVNDRSEMDWKYALREGSTMVAGVSMHGMGASGDEWFCINSTTYLIENIGTGGRSNHWYLAEIEYNPVQNRVNCNIYDSDGTTLLYSASDLITTGVVDNIALMSLNKMSYGGTRNFYWDDSTYSNSPGQVILEDLTDGQHHVSVYANDTAGNINYSEVYFTIDTTPLTCDYEIEWFAPIENETAKNVKSAVPIRFSITNNSEFQSDESVHLYVFSPSEEMVFNATYGKGSESVSIGKSDYKTTFKDGTTPGNYSIKVNFSNSCEFYNSFELISSGNSNPGRGSSGGGSGTSGTDKKIKGKIIEPKDPNVIEQVTATFSSISKGKTGTITMPETKDVPITEISIKVESTVLNVEVGVSTLSSRPEDVVSEAGGKVLKYMRIDHKNFDDSDIETVKIGFKVEKDWINSEGIDPATVVLSRYLDGEWKVLSTEKAHEDSDFLYYSAESPGLSYFAISGSEKPSIKIAPITAPSAGLEEMKTQTAILEKQLEEMKRQSEMLKAINRVAVAIENMIKTILIFFSIDTS